MDRVYNSSDSPVVIDEQGSQIDGRSWGEADTTSEIVAPLIESGRLVIVDAVRDPTPTEADPPIEEVAPPVDAAAGDPAPDAPTPTPTGKTAKTKTETS